MYKTGMLCPIPGFYVFIKHTDDSICMKKHDEVIQVEKFSRFPPARTCKNKAFWELRKDELVDLSRDKITQKL
jgi:hypothetical protein